MVVFFFLLIFLRPTRRANSIVHLACVHCTLSLEIIHRQSAGFDSVSGIHTHTNITIALQLTGARKIEKEKSKQNKKIRCKSNDIETSYTRKKKKPLISTQNKNRTDMKCSICIQLTEQFAINYQAVVRARR